MSASFGEDFYSCGTVSNFWRTSKAKRVNFKSFLRHKEKGIFKDFSLNHILATKTDLAGRPAEYVPLNWPITARLLNWVLCCNKAGYSPMLYDFLGFITDGFSGFFSSLPWEKEKENIAITWQFANLKFDIIIKWNIKETERTYLMASV